MQLTPMQLHVLCFHIVMLLYLWYLQHVLSTSFFEASQNLGHLIGEYCSDKFISFNCIANIPTSASIWLPGSLELFILNI
jgi:hypothetical protein